MITSVIKTGFSQEYFQQEVNYKISVKLDDKNHKLFAEAEIEYINNSPHNLNEIYFHLWPNAYKNKNTALVKQQIKTMNYKLYNADESERGYITNLDFTVNGEKIEWEYHEEHIDICRLKLKEPLKPEEKIIIKTPFELKIPSNDFSRLGHYKNSYQITQWYPKPAVYDKDGWHPMPYLDMGEFYSEFGSFDVSITLPENYVVGATGNLFTADEDKFIQEKIKETENKNINYKENSFPASSENYKTINYKIDNAHDFAWFADKRYNVLRGEVKLPHSGRTVTTQLMFTNKKANLWDDAIEYINDALYYYSLWYGDYPYDICTAVDGGLAAGGGMEYPTITVIGSGRDSLALEEVIMHEVGHNWFYGVLGFNERDYPYLDEGINTFSQLRYMKTKYGNKLSFLSDFVGKELAEKLSFKLPYHSNYEIGYIINRRRGLDQAISLASEDYLAMNYGLVVYMKAAFVFQYLMEYLGEEKFNKIMQEFYNKWKFKHPGPEDLEKVFTDNCDKDLSWFFNDILKTNKKIDYKIVSAKQENDSIYVKIRNSGDINCPVCFSIINNGKIDTTIWLDGFKNTKEKAIKSVDYDKIMIDANYVIPDLFKKNHVIRNKGLFKKTEAIKIKFLANLEDFEKNQLFWLPAAGWNNYNKFMIGGLFYNSFLPAKKFEYRIMPMFAFGNAELAGEAKFIYNILPNNIFRKVDFSLSGAQYALTSNFNYRKIKAECNMHFYDRPLSLNENMLSFNYIAATDIYYRGQINNFLNTNYLYDNKKKINPYDIKVNIQAGEEYVKSSITANYKISYGVKSKGIDFRLFAGKFLYTSGSYAGFNNFRLSGWAGRHDYAYEERYFGRTESISNDINFLSNQFVERDGGFALYTGLGQTDNWLFTLNTEISFPGKLPLEFYFNMGTYNNITDFNRSGNFVYESGIQLNFADDAFEIFFPIAVSDDLNYVSNLNTNGYSEKIRFTLDITKLNLFEYLSSFRM